MAQGLPLPACLKPPSLAKLAILRGLLAVAGAEIAVAAAELTVMAQVKKKMTNDEMVGLIREAMALRVKFRLKDENQKDRAKKILLLTMLCVNRHNRGPLSEPNYGAELVDQKSSTMASIRRMPITRVSACKRSRPRSARQTP